MAAKMYKAYVSKMNGEGRDAHGGRGSRRHVMLFGIGVMAGGFCVASTLQEITLLPRYTSPSVAMATIS